MNTARLALNLIAAASYLGVTLLFYGLFKPVHRGLSLAAASGYLIYRSSVVPPPIGVLMAVGGLDWLTFGSPSLVASWAPYSLAPGIIGEAAKRH